MGFSEVAKGDEETKIHYWLESFFDFLGDLKASQNQYLICLLIHCTKITSTL